LPVDRVGATAQQRNRKIARGQTEVILRASEKLIIKQRVIFMANTKRESLIGSLSLVEVKTNNPEYSTSGFVGVVGQFEIS
jgi:hypothetical protein